MSKAAQKYCELLQTPTLSKTMQIDSKTALDVERQRTNGQSERGDAWPMSAQCLNAQDSSSPTTRERSLGQTGARILGSTRSWI